MASIVKARTLSNPAFRGTERKGAWGRGQRTFLLPSEKQRGRNSFPDQGSNRTGARRGRMLKTYTAKYTRISSGYMGQLVEWPEVITEGKSLDDCRQLLQDALQEMIVAYRQQHKEIPVGGGIIEQIPVEI